MRHHAMNESALWNRIESRLDSDLPEWRERIEKMGQVAAVEHRSGGRTWSDAEVFEGLLLAVLSSDTDWSKVEGVRAELPDLFSGFCLEWYAERRDSEIPGRFVPWFKARKAGSRALRRGLVDLIHAARKLLEHRRAHGTAEDYFTSLMDRCGGDPKRAALSLGCPGEYKLPSLGVPLAAEALKNLGFDVAKPDVGGEVVRAGPFRPAVRRETEEVGAACNPQESVVGDDRRTGARGGGRRARRARGQRHLAAVCEERASPLQPGARRDGEREMHCVVTDRA